MQERRTIRMLFGRDGMTLSVPASATILEGESPTPLADRDGAVREGLAHPIGSDSLIEMVRRRRPQTVAITISDITRPVPNRLLVEAILQDLAAAGVGDPQITIIVGTGMHRPSTPAEKEEMLGADILARCQVADHRPDDAANFVRLSEDPPVSVNAQFASADFRIVTGLIEPHFMAGYSGGRKGVCPALADMKTIQRFHGHQIMGDSRSSNGQITDNPCHAESLRIARLARVDFLVNVALDRQRRLAGVYCGDMEKAHETGVAQVAGWNSATVDDPFDLVLTNAGGYPLDQTFYQSVKGMVTALPALHSRSALLIVSECGESVGSPTYTDLMMRWGDDWRGFLKQIAASDTVVKDQWQYQLQARVLERIGRENLWLACDRMPMDVQRRLGVTPLEGPGDAAARAQRALDCFIAAHNTPGAEARIAVIPEGPYLLLRPHS